MYRILKTLQSFLDKVVQRFDDDKKRISVLRSLLEASYNSRAREAELFHTVRKDLEDRVAKLQKELDKARGDNVIPLPFRRE